MDEITPKRVVLNVRGWFEIRSPESVCVLQFGITVQYYYTSLLLGKKNIYLPSFTRFQNWLL